jgi:hypothetical protein
MGVAPKPSGRVEARGLVSGLQQLYRRTHEATQGGNEKMTEFTITELESWLEEIKEQTGNKAYQNVKEGQE